MENGYIPYLIHISKKVLYASELKAIVSAGLGILTFFFDPLQQLALVALFVLVLIDFALGIAAARATGDAVRSAKLVRTGIKFTVYFTLIAAARITEHAIPVLPFLDETVTGFLAATELMSILENTGRLGFATPKKLTDLLGEYVKSKNKENRGNNSKQ